MTVSEVIKILKRFPGDLSVVMDCLDVKGGQNPDVEPVDSNGFSDVLGIGDARIEREDGEVDVALLWVGKETEFTRGFLEDTLSRPDPA